MTRWWLWIFGIDDRFDDLGTPEAELAEWSRRFARKVRQEPADGAADLLLAAFGAIRRDLARYPCSGPAGGRWRSPGANDAVGPTSPDIQRIEAHHGCHMHARSRYIKALVDKDFVPVRLTAVRSVRP